MNSWNGKRFLEPGRRLSMAFVIGGLLTACMQQDPLGPQVDQIDTKELEDPALLAGASSSTNWPVKTSIDTPISVSGKADSNLFLHFLQLDRNYQQQPKAVSGSISLVSGTTIPALNPVRPVRFFFSGKSSVEIPKNYLDSVGSRDTVNFTVLIEVDTLKCLLVGFQYTKTSNQFTQSPFSGKPAFSIQMEGSHYSFQGDIDTSALPKALPGYESAEMSFYIPGTSFHWKTRLTNPLSIGPLPSGSYPLQLIVVKPGGQEAKSSQVEIYEVLLRRETITSPWRFSIGQKLLARNLQGSVSLLSTSH